MNDSFTVGVIDDFILMRDMPGHLWLQESSAYIYFPGKTPAYQRTGHRRIKCGFFQVDHSAFYMNNWFFV